MSLEIGVCIVLPTGNTIEEVLAISRRNDPTQWGLPGGKLDPFETNMEALLREVEEECDLELEDRYCQPIYSGVCYGKDGRDFWVTTYLYEAGWAGEKAMEKGFELKRVEMLWLCNELNSPFAAYNRNVISAWRAYK